MIDIIVVITEILVEASILEIVLSVFSLFFIMLATGYALAVYLDNTTKAKQKNDQPETRSKSNPLKVTSSNKRLRI